MHPRLQFNANHYVTVKKEKKKRKMIYTYYLNKCMFKYHFFLLKLKTYC